MVSGVSTHSSSSIHKQDDINAKLDEQDTEAISINETTFMATEDHNSDGKAITLEDQDEKSGQVMPPPQQIDVPQILSDKDDRTPHETTETTQLNPDGVTSDGELDIGAKNSLVEQTESTSVNSSSYDTTKDSADSQARRISAKEDASTHVTAIAAAVNTMGQIRDQADNETVLHSERPNEPSSSFATSSTSSNQPLSLQTSNNPTTAVTQQGLIAENGDNRSSQHQPPSLDHEYLVKSIDWLDLKTNTSRVVRIITQNENGPCPLVSICNVLFIRGDLHMRPFERTSVTFEYLLDILGDYLLNHAPPDVKTPGSPSTQQLSSSPPTLLSDQEQGSKKSSLDRHTTMEYVLTYRHNLDTALTILPRLQTGLDVNVQFSSIHDFEPTEELALFDLFGVDLVHGWIIDPQDEEGYRVVNQCKSYNGIVECIVRGAETNLATNNTSGKGEAVDETKMATRESNIHDGLVASQFLEDSATQLTYYGIELLTDTLPKNKLCVLFRNNHFSTLYKHPVSDRLYTLVTDSGLVSEENIVWETLSDVDQGSSEFVTSQFVQPPPARARPAISAGGNQDRETADLDYAIALSLQQHQHEEIARTSQKPNSSSVISSNHRTRTSDNHSPAHHSQSTTIAQPHTPLASKKKSCIIS